MKRLEMIDKQIEQLLFQLGEYQGYVSEKDIREGCPTPKEIKEKIRELNEERKQLMKNLV